MPEIWVTNASPVIVLAKANRLDLLTDLADELILPDAVAAEILNGGESDPARKAVASAWGIRQSPVMIPNELIEWGLGPGETAVIAIARERMPGTAVLDDAAARSCAKAFGVPVLGTLGVILRAKKRGLISSAANLLHAVRASGLYLDDRVVRLALAGIGETW